MEINLTFNDYDFRNNEEVDQIDRLRRSIFQKFPNAIWERNGNGNIITV